MTARLKIVFITSGYPSPKYPNRNIFIHRSIQYLAQQVGVVVVQLRAWLPGYSFTEKRMYEKIPVLSVACPQLLSGSASHLNTKLLSWFGRKGISSILNTCDIIHSTDLYPGGFVAGQWADKIGKPCTSHVIGSDLNLFLAPNITQIGKDWLYKLAGVACNSTAIMRKLSGLVPNLTNVNVIYRGVDTSAFSPEGPIQGPQSALPPVCFLYLGGFHTWDARQTKYYNLKGGHILLDAWQKVEAHIGPSTLLIGGPGTDVVKLQKWRSTLRRPKAVFFKNAVPPSDVPALIRSCDVVVIPSLSEGLPNIANESQACARPVLGTDAGGIPESVVHGQTGLIVPRGDSVALASGMERFYTHQTDVPNMGMKGRERMIQHFSWERFSEQMMSMFHRAIEMK